eukprot:1438702-Rhodomonas_salina.1
MSISWRGSSMSGSSLPREREKEGGKSASYLCCAQTPCLTTAYNRRLLLLRTVENRCNRPDRAPTPSCPHLSPCFSNF